MDKTTLNRMGRQREKKEKAGIRYRVVSRSDEKLRRLRGDDVHAKTLRR